jgi:hypothetical protein
VLCRNDTFRQVINPLKIRFALGDGKPAASKMILKRPAGDGAMPVAAFAFWPLPLRQVVGRHRSLAPDDVQCFCKIVFRIGQSLYRIVFPRSPLFAPICE